LVLLSGLAQLLGTLLLPAQGLQYCCPRSQAVHTVARASQRRQWNRRCACWGRQRRTAAAQSPRTACDSDVIAAE
jgi:hypothetical protein